MKKAEEQVPDAAAQLDDTQRQLLSEVFSKTVTDMLPRSSACSAVALSATRLGCAGLVWDSSADPAGPRLGMREAAKRAGPRGGERQRCPCSSHSPERRAQHSLHGIVKRQSAHREAAHSGSR